jgi:hypothetical protein
MTPERELIAEICLYVGVRHLGKNLTTQQMELLADCVDEWQPDPEHPYQRTPFTRWWRDQ